LGAFFSLQKLAPADCVAADTAAVMAPDLLTHFETLFKNWCIKNISCLNCIVHYHHFVGHCGAFFGLKWKIWRAKMYFSPPK